MCAQQLLESLLDHLNLGSGSTRSVGMEAELPKGYRGTAKGDRGSGGGGTKGKGSLNASCYASLLYTGGYFCMLEISK